MVLLVAAGGAVGAVLRYGLSGLVQGRTGPVFPYGTLAVNVVGCLLMGVISELAESRGALEPGTRALITVGVLGGFTTFSAFGNETLNLLRDGERALAAGNIAANLILALAAVWAGRAAAAGLWR
ncbi:MAG TPA: fluoride efflux transporter CrcB [Gemmatimonadales bacterium]|nr:fluoride efflux transporter CrcB [Gemmatimonadales bacterium]